MQQKKMALINDVTGFGRCSIAVMAPIISVMKIQAVTIPTAPVMIPASAIPPPG